MTSVLALWGGRAHGVCVCLLIRLSVCDGGWGRVFHDMADDRSGTACLLIIVTAGGWKVLKEVKRKTVFFKVDEIREVIRKNICKNTTEYILIGI